MTGWEWLSLTARYFFSMGYVLFFYSGQDHTCMRPRRWCVGKTGLGKTRTEGKGREGYGEETKREGSRNVRIMGICVKCRNVLNSTKHTYIDCIVLYCTVHTLYSTVVVHLSIPVPVPDMHTYTIHTYILLTACILMQYTTVTPRYKCHHT